MRSGFTTELTMSLRYICGTAVPRTLPVLVTVKLTPMGSPAVIFPAESFKSP